MKIRLNAWAVFGVSSIILLLWGCGGGGGGEAGSISYTGLKTQAAIDSKNALDIVTSAYQGGDLGNTVGELGMVQNSTSDKQRSRPRTLILSVSLEKILHKFETSSISANIAVGTVITVSDTIAGDCGGSASFAIRLDDQTGNFTGSFNFSSYCSDNVTISGNMNASGQINLTTKSFVRLDLSSDSITVTSSNDSFTVAGDITLDFPSNAGCLGGPIGCPNTAVMNLFVRDESTGKVYWAKDYSIASLEFGDYLNISVSGVFYHPDHGYVVLSTQESLRINTGDDHPSSGILVFAASGGTKAQLIALSSTTFEVIADTNGDGIYDYHSGALNWSDLKPVSGSPPSPPTGVNAVAGNKQVTISWDTIQGLNYNLYMASESGVSKDNYGTLQGGMRHSRVTSPFVHNGLTNGTTYYFVATAMNANGESAESDEISTTPTISTSTIP